MKSDKNASLIPDLVRTTERPMSTASRCSSYVASFPKHELQPIDLRCLRKLPAVVSDHEIEASIEAD